MLIGFGGTARAQERVRLTMGSTSTASSHYTLTVAVAKATHDTYPEINITVAESGGAIENLQRMARGEIDLGISTSNASYEAAHGLEQFKGNPNKDIRWLFTYGNVPILLLARKATGIESIHDLNGKKFNPADVISINTDLNPTSRDMISAHALRLMKPTAILICCARGGIIDQEALRDALDSDRLYGAGIDVFEPEPILPDNPLLSAKNIVLTPHVAAVTGETLRRHYDAAHENVRRVLQDGTKPKWVVNGV